MLVLGGAGMLGHKLCQVLRRELDVVATFRARRPDRPEIYGDIRPVEGVDAADVESVARAVEGARADVIVNAIGIIKQRAAASEPIPSITINSLLPHRLAELCRRNGGRLIHFSTDCVFSGRRGAYTEDDAPDPVDLYGRSKLLGEVSGPGALTIRTSIIGRELENGTGLLEWFLSPGRTRVPGYARAIWSGVSTNYLARLVGELITRDDGLEGLFHVSTAPISKFTLLVALSEAFGTGTTVARDETVVLDRSLVSDRFWSRTGLKPPTWDDMLPELVEDSGVYEGTVNARR